MQSVHELKQIRDDLKALVERISLLPEGYKPLNAQDLKNFADSIPAYDSLIADIEKGNSHDADKELVGSINWTRDMICKINGDLDSITK